MKSKTRRLLAILAGLGVLGLGMALAGWSAGAQTELVLRQADGKVLYYSPWGIGQTDGYGGYDHGLLDGLGSMLAGLEDGLSGLEDLEGWDDAWEEGDKAGGTGAGAAGTGQAGEETIPLSPLKNVKIDVIAAAVEVQQGEGYSLRLVQQDPGAQLSYREEKGTLVVEEKQRGQVQGGNRLRLTVPEGTSLEAFEAATVSGNVHWEAEEASARQVVVETASGAIEVEGVTAPRFDLASISGKIQLDGAATEQVRAETTSGGIRLEGALEGQLTASSVSGKVKLELSGPPGRYAYTCSTVSGSVRVQGEKCPREIAGGSGPDQIDATTVSGAIEIDFAD